MALTVRFTWTAPHPCFASDGAAHGGWWSDGPLEWNFDDPEATGGDRQWEIDRDDAAHEVATAEEAADLIVSTCGTVELHSAPDLYGADAIDADGTVLCAHVTASDGELQALLRLLERGQ